MVNMLSLEYTLFHVNLPGDSLMVRNKLISWNFFSAHTCRWTSFLHGSFRRCPSSRNYLVSEKNCRIFNSFLLYHVHDDIEHSSGKMEMANWKICL